MRRFAGLLAAIVVAVLLALGPAGCAYYNTFYTAKKAFEQAELETKASLDPSGNPMGGISANYDKAILWSERVVTGYPTSKWVDDARLVIGRSKLAKGDYDGAIHAFDELRGLQPESELLDQAMFYTGVARERNRERAAAVATYDSVLSIYPNTKVADELRYHRAGMYIAMKQPERAEADLRDLATRKGAMGYDAALRLAEALFASKRYSEAREQFLRVADRAPTDKQRLEARLRVGDCDEAVSDYARAADTYGQLLSDSQLPEARARARLRLGSSLALSGRVDEGLNELAYVVQDMPRSAWAAEAMYRTGYVEEVVRDDLEQARIAYGRVAEQQANSPFVAQAKQRGDNLTRLSEAKSAASDTTAVGRAAQAAFESAELYMFQLGKYDRALEEYAKVEQEDTSAAYAPRAALARGWILARRMNDPEGAKGAYESIVTRWPASPEARTARRALENPTDSTSATTPMLLSSLQVPLVHGHALYVPPPPVASSSAKPATAAAKTPARPGAPGVADSLARAETDSLAVRRDSLTVVRRDSLAAPYDSMRARADSIRNARTALRDSSARFRP